MTSLENLHTAIGELAYAIARADGTIQKEERTKFQNIIADGLTNKDYDFDVADIIFQILDKDKYIDAKTSYDWAMKEIRMNSHYLSPELKETFIHVLEQIAEAYPPVTRKESELLENFKKDISVIHGDPVFYEKVPK
jgi:uncharacterized tellurite resistance protein B-like protein